MGVRVIKEKAKKYHNNMWSHPANEIDLADFAKQILEEFVNDLEKTAYAVSWNYGCDSVIFLDRSLEGRVSLKEMKEIYLGERNDKSNSDEQHGVRTEGDSVGDKQANLETEQSKGSSEVQEPSSERDREVNS